MKKSKKEIIDDINMHIKRCGGNYRNWYVGISDNARERLFTDHKVNEKKGAWIYRKTSSSDIARDIEYYFVKTIGTDGGVGGGDDTTDMVYAYKEDTHTNP